MVRIGEHFFTSLGFAPLPKTFWERSLFIKPRDREVVCHASAWDIDNVDDLRIKMCIDVTAEDFTTIHHELGHNFYQRAYNKLPMILRNSANDGFHEAIGDTLALSITPEYLVKIGLLAKAPDASADTGLLLRARSNAWRSCRSAARRSMALAGVRRHRSAVRLQQGLVGSEAAVSGRRAAGAARRSSSSTRARSTTCRRTRRTRAYFLAQVLQFQFYRALPRTAGCTAPLHRCSIYGSKDAGRSSNAMMEIGASKPWPDALEALTGQREMDASAMAEYFAPLKEWLDEQNKGKPVGW